jgi:hypothetical protein
MVMKIQGSPVGIQNPAHWNLISHSTTAPLPVLPHSSVLSPLRFIALSFPQGKILHAFQNVIILGFFNPPPR